MKRLSEQINESIILTTISYIVIGICALALIACGEGMIKGESYSGPLFFRMKKMGVVIGFISWLIDKIQDKKEVAEFVDYEKLVDKVCAHPDFQKWAKQASGKRKLKDLKVIVQNILTEKEQRQANFTIKLLWSEYNHLGNTITDIKTDELEKMEV